MLSETVPRSQRLRDRLRHQRRFSEGGETNPEDTGLVRGDELRGGFKGQARLARPARSREREKACPITELAHDLALLSLPTDEGARGPREVRVRDRLERREALLPKLVDRNRSLDVLQAVLAQIGERDAVNEFPSRLREQHLSAVTRGRDSRGEVHVVPDVALVSNERSARVESDAEVDPAFGERVRDRKGRGCRSRSGREGEEKGVSLRVYLDAILSRAGLADDAAVIGELLCVSLRTELVQELRRALHISEKKGDGAGREIGSHAA